MRELLTFAIAAVLVTGVLVLDPMYLFDRYEKPAFTFDDADMRVATEGIWELGHDGKTYRFALAQSGEPYRHDGDIVIGAIQSAHACDDDRSFVRSASACYTTTLLSLAGSVFDHPLSVRGGLVVEGRRFVRGYLELWVGDVRVGARLTFAGVVEKVTSEDGKPVTLKRIALSKPVLKSATALP